MLGNTRRPKNEPLDQQKINQFSSVVMRDLDATAHCALAYIGDLLGFYKAMAKAKDNTVTSEELANFTGTNERYVRDWLAEQASKHYVFYDPSTGAYRLPEEHAEVLVDEMSHYNLAGGFQLLISLIRQHPRIAEVFRTGRGLEWGSQDIGVFEGQARLNSSQYRANLSDKWLPALNGVENKLRSYEGAKVADVGCGYGISTAIMAKTYPNSSFVGFDNHVLSIEIARKRAIEQGMGNGDRLRFITAEAESFPMYGDKYDLVTFFDCFHDMGSPFMVARHVKDVLKPDGTLMLVEMASSDNIEENIGSPVGTNGYAGSIFVCLPTAFAQMDKSLSTVNTHSEHELKVLPLGGMPGMRAFENILRKCGFTKFRCALKNESNMILEAKP
jgi:2-polyprenyl-3-methyl-5-hydroxy-6-metoxy-1,4-benzoquinol methylase